MTTRGAHPCKSLSVKPFCFTSGQGRCSSTYPVLTPSLGKVATMAASTLPDMDSGRNEIGLPDPPASLARKGRGPNRDYNSFIGRQYGQLKVVGWEKHGRRTHFVCRCSCENLTKVEADNLLRGKQVSCGCIAVQLRRAKATKHGQCDTRLYYVWHQMKNRCYNPSVNGYKDYGARDITVCQEWRESFAAFRDWALSEGYGPGMSIERKDVSIGYSRNNCTFIPRFDQARNTRRTVRVSANGKTMLAVEWAQELGLSVGAIYNRIRSGHSPEKIVAPRMRKNAL
jgi:hypothetical protein